MEYLVYYINLHYITIIYYTMLPLSATYICIVSLFSMLIANPNLFGPRNSIRLHHSHTLQKHGFSRISLSSCGLEISCKGAACFGETLDPPNHRVATSISQQKNGERNGKSPHFSSKLPRLRTFNGLLEAPEAILVCIKFLKDFSSQLCLDRATGHS